MAWWRFWGGTSARLGLEPPASVPSTPPERSDARSVPLFDRWAVHEGRGLTPKRIVSLYADAEAGFPAGQCDLFEDVIERDAHLRSQLEGRLLAVAGKPLVVQAGGDGAEDVRAAQLFVDALAGVPNLRAMVAHQLKALWYGYAATEIDWGYRDGVVFLNMKGACSGCPSSTATLKHGIENLLRLRLCDKVEPFGIPPRCRLEFLKRIERYQLSFQRHVEKLFCNAAPPTDCVVGQPQPDKVQPPLVCFARRDLTQGLIFAKEAKQVSPRLLIDKNRRCFDIAPLCDIRIQKRPQLRA